MHVASRKGQAIEVRRRVRRTDGYKEERGLDWIEVECVVRWGKQLPIRFFIRLDV